MDGFRVESEKNSLMEAKLVLLEGYQICSLVALAGLAFDEPVKARFGWYRKT